MAKKPTKKAAKKSSAGRKKTAKTAVKKAAGKTVKKSKAAKKTAPKPTTKPSSALLCDVEHLMQIMVANDVTECDVEDGSRKINLKRGAFVAPVAASPVAAFQPVATPAAGAAAEAPAEAPAPKENLIEITSPMVGTFYAAPSPDSDPYVRVGESINDNTVVCIVEAMKVMNEIKAECSGTIREVCVKNAEPVEFGQVMFRVSPS
jgi:acetyl-CoA carboxylase biotin carboxyl carrier protein